MFVRLEFEDGDPVPGCEWIADKEGIFNKYLGRSEKSLPYAGFIDWYCDSTFSSVQMEPFLEDWDKIIEKAEPSHVDFLMRVRELAYTCRDSVSLYLKFYGD